MKTADIEIGVDYEVGRYHRARVEGFRARSYSVGQSTVGVRYLRQDGAELDWSHTQWVRPQDIKQTWADREAQKAEQKAAAERVNLRRALLAADLQEVADKANRAVGLSVEPFYVTNIEWGVPALRVREPEYLAHHLIGGSEEKS